MGESKKKHHADNMYFWRTSDQAEIDALIERDGELVAYEVKYNAKKTAKLPTSFAETYRPKDFVVVNRENCLEELGQERQ